MGSMTIKSGITFNGVSSVNMGVVIQTPPVYEFPVKRYEVLQIQGKNGDILIDKNSYNNVNREYNIAAVIPDGNFVNKAREIVDWLSSAKGYARLEDTYEPDHYRLAMFRSGGQLQNFFDKATGMVVRFECKPQRFLKTGDVIEPLFGVAGLFLGSPVEIINPTKYIALPEILISGENFQVEIESGETLGAPNNKKTIIKINGEASDVVINSELEDCYNSQGYLNNQVELLNEFPKLYPGKNWITISEFNDGYVEYASIKPRWWVL